jgi:hypothetical protein
MLAIHIVMDDGNAAWILDQAVSRSVNPRNFVAEQFRPNSNKLATIRPVNDAALQPDPVPTL